MRHQGISQKKGGKQALHTRLLAKGGRVFDRCILYGYYTHKHAGAAGTGMMVARSLGLPSLKRLGIVLIALHFLQIKEG